MREGTFFARLREDTAGNVLAMAAAAMIAFVALIGSAMDLSIVYMARGKLQNACDAAVLGARQSMEGTQFDEDVEAEGDRFFAFNFPVGTAGARNVEFELQPDDDNEGELEGTASATIPTSLVRILGIDELDISVDCDATRDMGHNDVMLVLDVTGSMNNPPSTGGADKIVRLRDATKGLYRALESDDGSIVRYGIVSYSHTVNVGGSLADTDILTDQWHMLQRYSYRYCDTDGYNIWNCSTEYADEAPVPGFREGGSKYLYYVRHNGPYYEDQVGISESTWSVSPFTGTRASFRNSGVGCIEERPTIDPSNPAPAGDYVIRDYVTRADVDNRAVDDSDESLQFGRYDPDIQRGESQDGCPSESVRFAEYDDETAFNSAINAATANVTGGTYHDVGMLWGLRFASRTGFFAGNDFDAGDNITNIDGVPVNTHIVFMTDGMLDTGGSLYSAHGIESRQDRTKGSGSQDEQHLARFETVCNLARSMGITVWVIALDVTDTDDVEACATSENHFYTSNGSDLEEVFSEIGRGIGNLRLTR